MNKLLYQIGIRDESFQLFTVADLIRENIIEKPLDGNHGEIHPKSEDFVDHGVPFIMASDINDGCVDYINCNFITSKQADSLRKGFAKNGDVLVTHKATIGRTAIVNYQAHPYIMLTPQVTYYRIRDKKKLNNLYLKYYFDSELFQKTIQLWAGAGSTRAYIGITAQHKLPVILPPIEKQEKISAFLSAYDNLIENNKRRIALLEKMAEEIYREWFVRFRFPGYQTAEFEKGAPNSWQQKRFDEFCTLKRGYDLPDSEVIDGEFPVIASTSIKTYHHKYKVNPPVITTGRSGSLGTVLFSSKKSWPLNTALYVKDFKGNSPYLIYYVLKNMKLENFNAGAGVPSLNRNHLAALKLYVPDMAIQKKFTNVIEPIYQQIDALKAVVENLKQTKDSLLPRLISGKLSVADLDIQFPPSMVDDEAA